MKGRLILWGYFVLFFGGALLGGSVGPYFPWPNLAGGLMILAAALLIPAVERHADENGWK